MIPYLLSICLALGAPADGSSAAKPKGGYSKYQKRPTAAKVVKKEDVAAAAAPSTTDPAATTAPTAPSTTTAAASPTTPAVAPTPGATTTVATGLAGLGASGAALDGATATLPPPTSPATGTPPNGSQPTGATGGETSFSHWAERGGSTPEAPATGTGGISPWWLAGGALIGAGALLYRRQRGAAAVDDSSIRVLHRHSLGGNNALLLVEVPDRQGTVRRFLIGTGGSTPTLVAELDRQTEAEAVAELEAVARTAPKGRPLPARSPAIAPPLPAQQPHVSHAPMTAAEISMAAAIPTFPQTPSTFAEALEKSASLLEEEKVSWLKQPEPPASALNDVDASPEARTVAAQRGRSLLDEVLAERRRQADEEISREVRAPMAASRPLQEVAREVPREMARETARDLARELAAREAARDVSAREPVREIPSREGRDILSALTAREPAREPLRESARELAREPVREATPRSARDMNSRDMNSREPLAPVREPAPPAREPARTAREASAHELLARELAARDLARDQAREQREAALHVERQMERQAPRGGLPIDARTAETRLNDIVQTLSARNQASAESRATRTAAAAPIGRATAPVEEQRPQDPSRAQPERRRGGLAVLADRRG